MTDNPQPENPQTNQPIPPPPQSVPQRSPVVFDEPGQGIYYAEGEVVEDGYSPRGGGGRGGCFWGLVGAGGCLSIPLILLVGVLLLGINTVDGVLDGVTGIFNPPEPVYTFVSTSAILERVQGMSQLTTARYNFSNIVSSERELPTILSALYRDRLTMVIAGHINAGVDLGDLTEEDIVIDGDTLTIRIPAPTLQDCFLNEQESYVVSRDTGLFTAQAPNLDDEARQFAVREFRDMALEEGILLDANAQAAEVIGGSMQLLIDTVAPENFSAVQIVTETPDTTTTEYPSSCR